MRTNQIIKTHFPAAATLATVTFQAIASRRWRLMGILASYSAAPAGGRLTVVSDELVRPDGVEPAAVTVLDLDHALAGGIPLWLPVDGVQMPAGNADMVITLASGAGAIVGKLTVIAQAE